MSRFILPTIPKLWVATNLHNVAKVTYGASLPSSARQESGEVLVFGSGGEVGRHTEAMHHGPSIIIGRKGSVGATYFVDKPFWAIDTVFYLDEIDYQLINIEYLFHYLQIVDLSRYAIMSGVPGINRRDIELQKIPLPPMSEQRRIVDMLRKAQNVRNTQRAIAEKSRQLETLLFYEMFGDPTTWLKTRPLCECVDFVGGGTPSRSVDRYYIGDIPWATSKDIKSRYIGDSQEHITEEAVVDSATNRVKSGTILMVVKSKILMHSLPMSITTRDFCFGQDLKGLACRANIYPQFIVGALLAQEQHILDKARGVNTEGLTLEVLRKIRVPDVLTTEQAYYVERVYKTDHIAAAALLAGCKLDDIFKALSAQAFTGDLTSAWREHHLPELQREAAERDARLAQKTRRPAALPVVMRPEPKTIEHEEPRYAVLRALSDTQRQVLDAARLQEGAFTPGQLMGALDGLSLARARETLRAFAAIGLIEPITMAKYPDGRDSGAAFVEAYRVAGRPAGPREE